MSWGQDRSLIYLRVPQEKEDTDVIRIGMDRDRFWYRDQSPYFAYTIGFCGKIYGCVEQHRRVEKRNEFGSIQQVIENYYCYDIEAVDRHVEKYYDDDQKKSYYSDGKKTKYGYRYKISSMEYTGRRLECEEFFSCHENKRDAYLNYFLDNKTPIFVQYPQTKYKKAYLIINEQLSKFNFAKLFDPVIAYQELSMFVGGMASPEKTIPDVSDEDLIEAKGFDGWSFRKMPSKKN